MIRLAAGLVINAVVFYIVVRLVPGLVLQAGRSLPRLAAIVLVAAVLATVMPWLVNVVGRRLAVSPRVALIVRAVAVIAGEATLLLALAPIARILGVRFDGAGASLAIAAVVLGGSSLAVHSLLGRADRRYRDSFRSALRESDRTRLAVFIIFLMSGAAGLIYEVVWSRQLVLVFGNTTQAVSAILTGYFGGLAIGSVIGGRLADKVRRPLRLYGLIELVLVGVVLVTPLLFRGMHELYRAGYAGLQHEPTLLALVRYGLALLALAPATILMGATLPTLSRHMSRRRAELGTAFGRLYAMNTIGAIFGTALAGLVLIELLGLTGTLVVGAIGSATAGIVAILLDLRDPTTRRASVPATAAAPDRAEPRVDPPPASTRRLALAVAFVSGLTSLGYQLLWTRLLASGSGNTTYVFSLILTVFLIGIAVGAAVVTRRLAGMRSAIALLGATQLGVAVIVLLGLVILSGWVPQLPFVARVVLVVLPATLVMGITLPLASSLVGRGEEGIGRDAGLLLGANTLGAIGGTFVVPFALIPAIGSPRSIVLLTIVNVGLGLWLLSRGRDLSASRRRWSSLAGASLAVVAIAGLVLPVPLVRDPGATQLARDSVLLASAEDEIAAVQAGGPVGDRRLLVGGTGMTRLTVDAKLMAYLPLITRPDAQRMLVICFGMGSSYRSGLTAGLDVDGIELVPSVPKMFGFFYPDADAVLGDPNGELVIADGRNFVELSDRTYDLIVVDPPPPIESAGTSVLYSREFYVASTGRLRPGGLMMEWMPYGQSVDEFRSHVRTFADVFPNVLIAFGPTKRGVYMLGSADPIAIDPSAVRGVLNRSGVLADLVATEDSPVTALDDWARIVDGLGWIEGDRVRAFGAGAPPIVDDRPVTEYFLLRRLLGPSSPPMNEDNLRKATPPG